MGRVPKPSHSTLILCDRAATMLKSAGFVHHVTSLQSEATYYRWPDRKALLRVSVHKSKKGMPGLDQVAARITFNGCLSDAPGEMHMAEEKIESYIATAIGLYFLNSATAL